MKEISRRDFVRSGLATGMGLGATPRFLHRVAPLQSSATTSTLATPAPGGAEKYTMVDPELVPVLKTFTTLTFDHKTAVADRQNPAKPPLPAPAPQPFDRKIPGPTGAPDLRLVTVDPAPGAKGRPAFLHIHGGGNIGGRVGQDPAFLQTIAMNCGCLVISVDYRLAPETKFPGSLEDNYAALQWIHNNAETLGVDRKRIAIGGESAGGGHAARLAIAARDRKKIPILFQLLIYPMLDDRTGSTRQVSPYAGQFVWIAASNRYGWTSLLGVPAGSTVVPAGSVPSREKTLAGLPPTFISVGALDLFVDEDIEYARRLIDAGVPTELHVIPGAFHGYDLLVPDAAVSKRFAESWTVALRRAYATS
jgi:acetyl esterase/lipase